MDFIQDYFHVLSKFLPPSLFKTLISATTTAFGICKTLQAHISPFLYRVLSQPDVASILLLAVIAFVSFKIFDMAYRAVLFWISLAYKLAMFILVVSVATWIYNRGPEGFMDDVGHLGNYWMAQFEKFSDEVNYYQSQKEGQIRREQQQRGWW